MVFEEKNRLDCVSGTWWEIFEFVFEFAWSDSRMDIWAAQHRSVRQSVNTKNVDAVVSRKQTRNEDSVFIAQRRRRRRHDSETFDFTSGRFSLSLTLFSFLDSTAQRVKNDVKCLLLPSFTHNQGNIYLFSWLVDCSVFPWEKFKFPRSKIHFFFPNLINSPSTIFTSPSLRYAVVVASQKIRRHRIEREFVGEANNSFESKPSKESKSLQRQSKKCVYIKIHKKWFFSYISRISEESENDVISFLFSVCSIVDVVPFFFSCAWDSPKDSAGCFICT